MSAPRVLVIYKRTTFQRFRGGKSTRIQALLEQGHRSVDSMLEAHEAHLATLERTKDVLKQLGVAAVYTPKDFDMNRIMGDLVGLIEKRADEKAA